MTYDWIGYETYFSTAENAMYWYVSYNLVVLGLLIAVWYSFSLRNELHKIIPEVLLKNLQMQLERDFFCIVSSIFFFFNGLLWWRKNLNVQGSTSCKELIEPVSFFALI